MNTFGEYLKELREASGKTLRQVEKETKISNAYLSQLENGNRIPTLLLLADLAEAYQVKFTDLMDTAHSFMGNKKTSTPSKASSQSQRISQIYDTLTPEHQAAISHMVNFYAKEQRKNKAG